MAKKKHTPTLPQATLHVSKLKALPHAICNEKGVVVATCNVALEYTTEEERRRNALLIMEACNAHDALLKAARLVVAGGDQCFCHAGPTSWGRHRLGLGPGPCDYCVAKAAIALAEGKTGGRLPYEKPRIIDEFPVTTAA